MFCFICGEAGEEKTEGAGAGAELNGAIVHANDTATHAHRDDDAVRGSETRTPAGIGSGDIGTETEVKEGDLAGGDGLEEDTSHASAADDLRYTGVDRFSLGEDKVDRGTGEDRPEDGKNGLVRLIMTDGGKEGVVTFFEGIDAVNLSGIEPSAVEGVVVSC